MTASGKEGKIEDLSANRRRESGKIGAVPDLVEIEGRLFAERRELLSEFAAMALESDELSAGWQDRDSASEDELREVEFTRRDSRHRRLALVDEALIRLREGTYGVCLQCEGAIAAKRLRSDPASTMCIACAKATEGTTHFHTF